MKKLFFILLFFFINIKAQINIQYLNDVPESFKKEYFSKTRNYNPLHVGDVWQYFDPEYNTYSSIKVLKDSIINGKKYYKKLYYPEFTKNPSSHISWERNDTINGITLMLDFQDLNENGDFLDELPSDSLELPLHNTYTTYKYSFTK